RRTALDAQVRWVTATRGSLGRIAGWRPFGARPGQRRVPDVATRFSDAGLGRPPPFRGRSGNDREPLPIPALQDVRCRGGDQIHRRAGTAARAGEAMTRILYLHGFASGPASNKARFFSRRLEDAGARVAALDLARGDFEHLTISSQLKVVEQAAAGEPVRSEER